VLELSPNPLITWLYLILTIKSNHLYYRYKG